MAIKALFIILAVLAVLLVAGVPISYAIGISSLAAILQVVPLDVSVLTAAQRTFVGMSKFSLTAIPFFILAGNLMNQGGIAKKLVDFVMAILGKLPGALLVTNIGTNALFGAISGSASAAAAAVPVPHQSRTEQRSAPPWAPSPFPAAGHFSPVPPYGSYPPYGRAPGSSGNGQQDNGSRHGGSTWLHM